MIRDYLAQYDLEPVSQSMGGYILDDDNDWYCYYAMRVEEIIGPDDPEYWESNAWYYDEENNIMYDSYEDYINGDGIKFEG